MWQIKAGGKLRTLSTRHKKRMVYSTTLLGQFEEAQYTQSASIPELHSFVILKSFESVESFLPSNASLLSASLHASSLKRNVNIAPSK